MDLSNLEREFEKDLTKPNPIAQAFGIIVVLLLGLTLLCIMVGAFFWAWKFVADSLSAL